jgi:protein-disulfide isomerase
MRAVARRIVLALAAAGLLAACNQGGGGGVSSAVTNEDMVLGNANAPVTVIEYASVTCPHCAKWNEEVFPAVKAKYIDTGQVKYVFREYLTDPVPVAAAGFLIARCAGKEKYFSVIDALFHGQTEIYQSGDPRSVLFRIGQSAGLTDQQITACISDEKALEALQNRVTKNGEEAKIAGTPTFLFNGKKFDGQTLAGTLYSGGEITLAQFDAAVQPLLKK